MFHLQCPQCQHDIRYDGRGRGYFVKNNSLVVDIMLLYQLISPMSRSTSVTGFTEAIQSPIEVHRGSGFYNIRRDVLSNVAVAVSSSDASIRQGSVSA